MSLTFTEQEVIAGVQLIQASHEYWPVSDIDPKEFVAAMSAAKQPTQVDWSGCCC
jgi:hypothetical protein